MAAALGFLLAACGRAAPDFGIYVTTLADGATRWIGEPPGVPVWSPTKAEIAWGSEDGLVVQDLNLQKRRALSTQAVAGVPAWTPDGGALAFVNREERQLTVIDMPSGQVRFATPISNPAILDSSYDLLTLGSPSWSPDGAAIAFSCWDGAGDEVCTIGADGRGRRQLTQIESQKAGGSDVGTREQPAMANTGPAVWSPDGKSIAVAVYPERRGAPAGLFVIDLDLGTARKVSSLQPNWELAWFPDGASLLCAATRNGRSDVYRVSLKDGETTNLTEGLPSGARYPALDSSGALLAVVATGEIAVLGLESGSVTAVDVAGSAKYPAWSGDGSEIAYSSEDDPIGWYE